MGLLDSFAKSGIGSVVMGPVGAIAGPLMGGSLLGGGGQPNYDAPDLDPGTKEMIGGVADRAQRTDDQFREDILGGTDKAHALQSANDAVGYKTGALGGEVGQMSEALNRKASHYYDVGQSDLKRAATIKEPQDRFHASSVAQQNALSWKMIETERARRLFQQQADQDAARNKVIGDILGVGGMIGGAIVGGPAGAVAGGAVGRTAAGAASGGGTSNG